MILKKLTATFPREPLLTTPIEQSTLETSRIRDFDKDGYEILLPVERLYYNVNHVILDTQTQYHVSPGQTWYIDREDSELGLVLDHCMLLTRYAFAGLARQQLEEIAQRRPIFNKLLGIKPKWGIDFSLDWVNHNGCMEVIHIEQDFMEYELAVQAKQKLEHIIENTDWEQGAKDLLKCKHEWENLSSDDHSDYKARFFGWHRAFDNIKVFNSIN
jgi:hypothetical protein